jgi:hypothetical protein
MAKLPFTCFIPLDILLFFYPLTAFPTARILMKSASADFMKKEGNLWNVTRRKTWPVAHAPMIHAPEKESAAIASPITSR